MKNDKGCALRQWQIGWLAGFIVLAVIFGGGVALGRWARRHWDVHSTMFKGQTLQQKGISWTQPIVYATATASDIVIFPTQMLATATAEVSRLATPATQTFPRPTPLPTALPAATPLSSPASLPLAPTPVKPAVLPIADTRLIIGALNLDVPVIEAPIKGETWDVSHLGSAVGHLAGTAAPGAPDNVVLAGHITLPPDGHAGPFVNLKKLQVGDSVKIVQGVQTFTDQIDKLSTVKPTAIQVTYPRSQGLLTLITCSNYNQLAGQYTDRLVAVGHLVN